VKEQLEQDRFELTDTLCAKATMKPPVSVCSMFESKLEGSGKLKLGRQYVDVMDTETVTSETIAARGVAATGIPRRKKCSRRTRQNSWEMETLSERARACSKKALRKL